MKRPISPGLAPNLEIDDTLAAIKIFCSPTTWKSGENIAKVEEWFKKTFCVTFAVSFNSGRSAQLAILKAMGIGKGDEVLVQAFTCVAVPNSVIWAGALPIYIDTDQSFTMDPVDLERKISKKSKAIIVQHTFGIPAQIEKILAIAKKHKLFVIEDCAHCLNISYKGKRLGTWGDAAFFSFGRDKIVSSVFGGMAITNNSQVGGKLQYYHQKLSFPSLSWIVQQLLHPILFFLILPLYNFFNLGKLILFISQKFHLLSFPVYTEEKRGERPSIFPARYPNALASLLLVQLGKLDRFTARRKEIVDLYRKEIKTNFQTLPLLRFPILVKNRDEVIKRAKEKGIGLGNWYQDPIAPKGVVERSVYFNPGEVPFAVSLSKQIINLPTYPTLSHHESITIRDFIKELV